MLKPKPTVPTRLIRGRCLHALSLIAMLNGCATGGQSGDLNGGALVGDDSTGADEAGAPPKVSQANEAGVEPEPSTGPEPAPITTDLATPDVTATDSAPDGAAPASPAADGSAVDNPATNNSATDGTGPDASVTPDPPSVADAAAPDVSNPDAAATDAAVFDAAALDTPADAAAEPLCEGDACHQLYFAQVCTKMSELPCAGRNFGECVQEKNEEHADAASISAECAAGYIEAARCHAAAQWRCDELDRETSSEVCNQIEQEALSTCGAN